jgi:ParB family chromosome partitioning protein
VTRERRLGRGLEALLGGLTGSGSSPDEVAAVVDPGAMFTPESQSQINLADIDPNPFQPRREFDEVELANLADSIREHGMLQPVAVRRVGDRYQLIAGERRLRAATMADWQTIPARVVEADDRQLVELAIVENLQRKDLNPLEKAASFQRYLEQYQCTQEELARRLQLDRSTIANLIRLLELPLGVQDALRSGSITQGHARALLPLGDESEQVGMCRRVVTEGMSVRAVEAAVQEALHSNEETPLGLVTEDGESKPAPRPRSEHLAALEQELRAQLGAKVEIKEGSKGRGKLVIHFSNHEEFERLRQQLAGFSMPLSQAG